MTDNNLSWYCHINQMIPKPNKTSYLIRSLKRFLYFESFKMVFFSTVHLIISYGIIFWGISTHCKIIFKIKKKILVRIKTFSKRTRMFVVLKEDLIMIYIFLQQIWQYFRKECVIQVSKSITIFHQPLKNCHMIFLNLKRP